MTTEFQNLTQLLEAIQLTQNAHEKLKLARENLTVSETENKEGATEEFNRCSKELVELKEKEETYRKIACSFLVAGNEVRGACLSFRILKWAVK